jgi:hypothetical protein
MYRCQICDRIVPPKTRQHKLTVATRPKVYPSRGPEPSERRRFRGRGRPKAEPRDRGGSGFEIVQEVSVCPKCAAEHEPPPPTRAAPLPRDDSDD